MIDSNHQYSQHGPVYNQQGQHIHGDQLIAGRDIVVARSEVEEFLGAGVLDALQLMTRGHDGSMMLIHANNTKEALEQVEMLIMFNHTDLPVPYLRKLIGSSIDLVTHQSRLADGSRKITAISEVVPDRQEGYTLRHIVVFRQSGVGERGKIVGTHHIYPVSDNIIERLRRINITLPPPFMQAEEHAE